VYVETDKATSLAADLYYKQEGQDVETEEVNQNETEYVNLKELQHAYSASLDVGKPDGELISSDEGEADDLYLDNTEDVYSVFGDADPNSDISDVPCAGCGACLHCQDPAIVGYMPSQRYNNIDEKDLRKSFCQRCILMRRYNIALNAALKPDEYQKVISAIKVRSAENRLALVVIDIMDMPNSAIPQLSTLIGRNRPLIIVGNKVDLLPRDESGYLDRVKAAIRRTCQDVGIGTDTSIKHVALISAKTGYGIEELIDHLLINVRGSVYIVGSTNCGKSTLFNSLLSSDYCKSSARDFIKRATTCVWPGTTLNLLRFPILYPARYKLLQREKRLKQQRSEDKEIERMNRAKRAQNRPAFTNLVGHVGTTFETLDSIALAFDDRQDDPATYSFNNREVVESGRGFGDVEEPDLDEEKYKHSHWCYDSPGLVNKEQVINQLTQAELAFLLSKSKYRQHAPRTFLMLPGESMLISGLARLDYVQGEEWCKVYCTVIANSNLPIYLSPSNQVDEYYNKHVGTDRLGLPIGDSNRLAKLSPLEGPTVEFQGSGSAYSVGDLVFSSLGWAAVATEKGKSVSFSVRTPGGVGALYRSPALLPYALNFRGKRLRGTAYFRNDGKHFEPRPKHKPKTIAKPKPDHIKFHMPQF